MRKHQQRIMYAVFGYALMVIGVITIASCFVFYLAFGRPFRSDELAVVVGGALVLIYLGYYIAGGEKIPLPPVRS